MSIAALAASLAACSRDRIQGLDADASAPALLDFGQLQAGERKTLPLDLSATGQLTLIVNGAQTASPFAVDSAPATIEQGSTGTLQITFAPRVAGSFTVPLTIALSSLRTPTLTVQLKGIAVAVPVQLPAPATLAVTPARLEFVVKLPTAPAAQTLTLIDGGDLGLSWSASADGPELVLSSATGSLGARATSQISVSVAVPRAPTDVVRNLTFTATGASAIAPVVIPIQIKYLQPAPAPAPAALLVEPTTLLFSSRFPSLPAAQTFRVHNTGASPLHFQLGLPLSLSLAPLSGALAPGAVAEVTVQVPSVPSRPTTILRTLTVQTQEAGAQDVAITIAFNKPGPPPPPPQYGNSVWPKFHQGNTCTGLSSVSTATRGHLRFTARFGPARMGDQDGTYVGSPTLADDGTVYQLGGDGFDGAITAFDPQRGTALWSTPITSPASISPSIEATPTVVKDGSIFVMTGAESASTHFYKLDRSGQILWTDQGGYGDGFDSSPALGADGTLYLAYDDAPSILFFSQGDASQAPAQTAEIGLTGRSATQSDLESQSGAIADDGTAYWAANGLLWAMNRAGLRFSHDATDGEFLWIQSRSAPLLTPDGAVIFTYANTDFDTGAVTTTVTAVSASSPARLWQRKLGPTAPAVSIGPRGSDVLGDRVGLSSPALGPDGTLYVGHADGLYSLDPASGAVNWHAGSALVASSPAVGADGTIFFGAMDGKLTAVDPGGHQLWQIPTGGQVNSSPAIGADGAVFVASDDGLLYAVE